MNLQHIPAIDVHAHPFPAASRELSAQQLRDAISVSLRGPTRSVNETMLLARLMVHELSRLLECEPTFEAIIAARNAAARDDYSGYIARLFGDANIEMLLVDHGFPANPELPFEPFAALLPWRPIQGYRIERFFPSDSFHGDATPRPFQEMLTNFEERLDAAVRDEDCRFFKSVMAYRTGLAIKPVELEVARDAWAHHRSYGDASEKVIRDYLFAFTAAKARQHELPFQLHTGHTSHVNIWPNTNPILLTPILNSGALDGARLVLVHGGYPYCTEGGYLTSVYPEVYLDLSLMIPWASAGVARRIHQTLESAPTGKVMYGSDGIICPEMHWIASILGHRALGTVLDDLIHAGFLTATEAERAAQDVLHRNARHVYRIASA
jgi:hypothetical protein